ncbi:DNA-3-methyladenine glycosylase family protein [Rhodopirellula europaea]|uniref:DNA-3-methyladenine glycosylase family protein n=1 Tax=Rhodopirellula europaea TaxID=1263866 RepID=UPI0003484773|nr:DNA-3-methyladenine glycosylase 2 family protein [Rhodopirellula europaea]
MPKLFVPKSQASGAGRSLENEQGVWPPEGEWKAALLALAETDPALRLVWQRLGDPPSWRRPAGFETLARIILEQQVSLRSAESTFHKLQQLLHGPLTPPGLVQLSADQTRVCGVSRQKHRYLNQLADDIMNGRFALDRLSEMTNREALAQLTARLGIGRWSAEVYLMSALNRPDILPFGDLGLLKGVEELDGGRYDDFEAVIRRADRWRPHRSMATRLVWALYLDNRGLLNLNGGSNV